MYQCNVDHNDNRNNGLITKIWGGPGWIFLHSITFGYPINPTPNQKNMYRDFFINLGNVLPCRFCRESYIKFITEGDTALTDNVLENRENLTKWLYNVHNAVNNKLEINYAVSYEDVVDKYESFRARCDMNDPIIRGCITPLDYKAFSYKKLNQIDCPVVEYNDAKYFIQLAKLRKIDKKYFAYLPLVEYTNGDIMQLKNMESWIFRNKFCQKQIKFMRESGIPSIETNGKWKNTPTIEELKLFLFLSSNLNKSEILQIINQIKNKIQISFDDNIKKID